MKTNKFNELDKKYDNTKFLIHISLLFLFISCFMTKEIKLSITYLILFIASVIVKYKIIKQYEKLYNNSFSN